MHLFLVLCWNTMVRNCNCDDIVFANSRWQGDSFGVSVKKTKTNKEAGSQQSVQEDVKHIYANKYMPEICLILAMALYFLVFPTIGTGSGRKKFFPMKNAHKLLYIYASTHAFIVYMFAYTCKHACIHSIHACIYKCKHACIHSIHACIYTCKHACIHSIDACIYTSKIM